MTDALQQAEIDAEVRLGKRLDELQLAMLDHPEAILEGGRLAPLIEDHAFLPGLYIRRVVNVAGSLTITMKHKVKHTFQVLRGHIRVRDLSVGEAHDLFGGDCGVTPPGTQRVIYAVEETEFVTMHQNPDNETNLAILEERFIERQELEGGQTAGDLYRERLRLLGDGK